MCRGIFAKSSVIEARIIRKIVALMERGYRNPYRSSPSNRTPPLLAKS